MKNLKEFSTSADRFEGANLLCPGCAHSIIVREVLNATDVQKVKDAGGSIIVSPNTDVGVIEQSISLGMVPMPGFQTATEALTAIKAGATYLKLFPAN
ncbi:MAG: hypothetical protein COB99_01205, partial [Sulfurimonas sp.]